VGEQTIPEPPDRSVVLVGPEDAEQVYLRDDRGLTAGDLYRWWSLNGWDESEAATWAGLLAKGRVERLHRQDEVDQLVAKAVATVAYHSPEEIAAGDRLAEEDGRG
jgi:hypothetical protein